LKVEKTGRTVEEAIQEALNELNVSREEVDVQVLEEGSRGFLGIGSRPYVVEVTLRQKENPKVAKAEEFLRQILAAMDINNYQLEAKYDGTQLSLELTGPNLGTLIGKRGQTLNDLQYIISLATNRAGGEFLRISLDVGGYRRKRAEALSNLANSVAEKVVAQGRRKALEPMNPRERRIIHTALQDNNNVYTYSEGKEPFRRVIIAPKNSENPS
jgi:spoIIIJ-associated protein